jgi:hypothetical protein
MKNLISLSLVFFLHIGLALAQPATPDSSSVSTVETNLASSKIHWIDALKDMRAFGIGMLNTNKQVDGVVGRGYAFEFTDHWYFERKFSRLAPVLGFSMSLMNGYSLGNNRIDFSEIENRNIYQKTQLHEEGFLVTDFISLNPGGRLYLYDKDKVSGFYLQAELPVAYNFSVQQGIRTADVTIRENNNVSDFNRWQLYARGTLGIHFDEEKSPFFRGVSLTYMQAITPSVSGLALTQRNVLLSIAFSWPSLFK